MKGVIQVILLAVVAYWLYDNRYRLLNVLLKVDVLRTQLVRMTMKMPFVRKGLIQSMI